MQYKGKVIDIKWIRLEHNIRKLIARLRGLFMKVFKIKKSKVTGKKSCSKKRNAKNKY